MKNIDFQAFRVEENPDGTFRRSVKKRKIADLPAGEVLIQVHYSSLNYKDALSAFGNKGVTRHYPHTPGIDASGIVVESQSPDFPPGMKVIVTSYDLGMNTDGGFGGYIRVPADWVVPLPEGLTLRESMFFGTAGLTAAQSIDALIRNGIHKDSGPVIVTGARGGVGSLAIMMLHHLGFEVIAGVSTHHETDGQLLSLGARKVVDSQVTADQSGKALIKSQWAAGIDTIGGLTLSTLLRGCDTGGSIVTVGNIESGDLPITVYPFIIRGVSLLGVGTEKTAMKCRRWLWDQMAGPWKPPHTEQHIRVISLDELDHYLHIMIGKKSRGRIVLTHEPDK